MAEFKLGRIKFVYQGAWQDTGYSYVVDDVVTVAGKTYICVVSHSSAPAFTTDLTHNPTYWNIVADGSSWTGAWQTNHDYNLGDQALWGGIVYICKTAHTSNSSATAYPGGLEADQNKWDAFAANFNWLGAWTGTTRYKVRDLVTYGGTTYVCNEAHISQTYLEDDDKWDIFNAGIIYQGEWSGSSVRYKLNDVVRYGADLWICTAPHSSSTTFDNSKWSIFVNGFQFENSWTGGTTYQLGDIVTYGGYTYICKQNHSTSQTPSTATSYWDIYTTGFNFQGDWDIGTSYKIGSVVRLNGYTYLATADSLGQVPPNVSYWARLNSGVKWNPTVQTFTAVAGTNLVVAGSPTGAKFDITASGTTYTVVINSSNKGTGYTANDTIKILGTDVGGLSPANDIIVTVTGQTGGEITTVSNTGISVTWADSITYVLGDVVLWGVSSYICVAAHIAGTGNRPDNDSTGLYWNLLASGTEQAVLTTQGDMFYYGSNGPTRLPIGTDGQILRVNNNIPAWQYYGQINNIVYVAPSGDDVTTAGQGTTIDKPWKSIRYACQQVENGYLNTNARTLLQLNKQFLIKETNNYVKYNYSYNVVETIASSDGSRPNQITVAAGTYQATTASMYVGMPISFTVSAGNLVAGTTYYVLNIIDSTHFRVTATIGGTSPFILTTSSSAMVGAYVYSTSKTERDAGLVIDGVAFDISHGGTFKSITNAKSYFTTDGASLVSGVSSYDITPFVASLNYLKTTLFAAVLGNTAPVSNYQTLNGVSSGSQGKQQINLTFTSESGTVATVSSLVSLITNALTAGTTAQLPAVINPQTTVSVKTGTYNEILPIVVPAFTAIVGDELRSTVVQPGAANQLLATVVPKNQAALTHISALIPDLISNTTITPTAGNTESQITTLPAGTTGSTVAINNLKTSFDILYELVSSGLGGEPAIVMPSPTGFNTSGLTNTAYATTTGSNPTGSTAGYGDGVTQIRQNYAYIVAEVLAYFAAGSYSSVYASEGTTGPSKGYRDITYILDSIIYDMTYGGNLQSNVAGSSYYSIFALQISTAEKPAFIDALGRLKTIITTIVQKGTVSNTAGNNLTQVTGGTAGSAAAGGFAQDRVQNVINWITNATGDADIAPYYGWTSSALQTAYTTLVGQVSNIQSDAVVWCQKYYQSVAFSTSLASRDTGLIINALAYDMIYGSNFNAIQAGRAFNRANPSAITLRSGPELPQTIGAINFMYYKAKQIAASGAVVQIQTTIDDIIDYLDGGVEPRQITWAQPALPTASYTGVTGLVLSGGGNGSAAFTIVRSTNGNGYYNYVITPTTPGASYTTSSKIKILGTAIGGATPTNDIVLNVTQVSTGGVVAVTYSDSLAAVGLLESNRAFVLAEVIAYINTNYSGITTNPNYTVAKTQRDASYILDAVHYDLVYGGNWASQNAGMAYYSALYGSQIDGALQTAFSNTVAYISTLLQSIVVGTAVGSPLQVSVAQVLQTTSGMTGAAKDATQAAALITIVKNFVDNGLTTGAPTITVTAIATNDTFTSAGHGMKDGDIVIPQTTANGLTSTIIGSQTSYYVVSSATNTFKLAASYAGTAITTFTNGTGLTLKLQALSLPSLTWVNSTSIAAYSSVSSSVATYQTSVITFINTNYSALVYNTAYAQRDTYNVTLASMLDMMLGSNFAAIQAGRAYNRSQNYKVLGYEKIATVAALNYLETLIASTLSSTTYSTQLASAQTSIYLTINLLENANGVAPEINGTVNYNNSLGIINGSEILRANIPFLAAETTAWYDTQYGGTVNNLAASGNVITTSATHRLSVNDPVSFTYTGITDPAPTNVGGISTGTVYFVSTVLSTTTFTISAVEGYLNSNTGTTGSPVILTDTASPALSVKYAFDIAQTLSDMTYFLNGIVADLQYIGNYRSLRNAEVLLNAVNGSSGSDMFHVQNGTGLRNMTMNGLTGVLTNPNSFGTKRITGGSYASLDPGFGPNDSNAWIYSRSCYTQNCTMFGYAVAGAKVDGALHAGGYRSMVANDYTTIIGDGIGYWVTGSNAQAELVSVFNYYGYAGYLSELGGKIRATNGNSSYGTYGVVAEGVDTFETPIYGTLNNRYFQAQITNVITDATNEILRFEYSNAGSNYTNAVPTISGSGYNATAVHDEFRDAAVFETRLIDTGTTSNPSVGGTSYVTQTNVSQGGATGYITIAATDTALSNAYNGMRIQLIAGTGVGQYANVVGYANGTKVMQVAKDSFTPLVITSTSSTNNLLTVASTAGMYAGMPIYFASSIDNITGVYQAGLASVPTLYYVNSANFSATQFQVSLAPGGAGTAVTLTGVAGSTVTVTATVITNNIITATNTLTAGKTITFSSSFAGIDAGTTYYVLATNLTTSGFSVSTYQAGPAVTITATGAASSTGTIGTAMLAAGWDNVVAGKTNEDALDLTSGYIIEPRVSFSAPGYEKTARTLSATATWSAVTYGGNNYVAVSNTAGATTTSYSTTGNTWSAGPALPTDASAVWSSIAFGGGENAVATAVVGGFGGSGAVLQAVIGTGSLATQIVSVTVVSGGYNYLTPPTISIVGGSGTGATATCTVLNGAIQTVTMVINGSGYVTAPTVTAVTSALTSVTVNSWGKNYYSTPTVTISQPQGLTPVAFALNTVVTLGAYLQTAAGKIYYVSQAGTTDIATTPSFDYTSTTYTNVTNGSAKLTYIATQAQATPTMTNAGVSSIGLSVYGYGYTSVPTVTILDTTAKFVALSSATTKVGYITVAGLAVSGTPWSSTVSNASSNQTLRSVAYGGGYYVAVGGTGGTGTAASSSDGISWIARTPTALSTGYYAAVAFGNSTFVAVNNGARITTVSANSGATWTAGGSLPVSFTTATSLAYGNGRFVVLGSDGKIAYSIDKGTTWLAAPAATGTTTSVLSSSYTWTSVAYGQGQFMAIAQGTTVCASSPDGINWTVRAMPSSSNWKAITFGNPSSNSLGAQPKFVAVSNTNGTVAASIRAGATPLGRLRSAAGSITETRMIEPGSGFAKGNVTATTTSTNVITVDDITLLSTSRANNQPIEFSVASGGLTTDTTYYVIGSSVTTTVAPAGTFQVAAAAGSTTAVTLTTTAPTGMIYRAGAVVTQIDPNRVTVAGTRVRLGDGALANPSFGNRGSNNATATASTLGDGYADIYQNSAYINISGLYSIPSAGANVQFSTITGSNQWYKLVAITNILGTAGNYTAQFQVNPALTTLLAPTHNASITTRLKYSQVRLTGHDFLYIGTGNQSQTNYPYVNAATAIQSNQELNTGGGRTFFTSTDQDGNFNVGNLFGVQQSTGTATLNASAFNLAGLQSLTLGAVSLGVGSATITSFSTDPYFTANSDNVLPTQKAIKSFITAQIGGGSSSLNVNTLTSGQIYVANNSISNTTGNQIVVSSKMNFTGGIDGAPVALVYFGQK